MDAVEEIKRRLDPVEFIGRFTRLQKAGRNFRGLCPFHTEKTPSFYVFPDRGTWRCFGSCGEGGDIFSFVQKRENLEFREALRLLADEAGVQLSPQAGAQRSRTEHLGAIVTAAVAYYEQRLRDASAAAAREYIFERRGITPEAVAAFHLGWAPDEWRGLRDYLAARGFDDHDGVAAGLLIEPESGGTVYDRFRGRVIIPIADERGHFVALGGRILGPGEPKYLNSPQTDLFDKGRTLFGLNLAAEAIRKQGVAVVVEGYMDVIGPWQAGFQNVVATMGTSLTEQHVRLLRRYASRVVLAMDPDAAGMAAAERAGALFLGFDTPGNAARSARSAEALVGDTDMDLRVAPLPPGKDPDEVARAEPAAWQQAIETAQPYAEFLIGRVIGDAAVTSAIEARRVVDRLRPVLLAVSDPVERAVYIQRVARRLGISETAVLERIRPPALSRAARRHQPPAATAPAAASRQPLTPEQGLLAILLRHPDLRPDVRHWPERLFTDALDREVFRRWLHEVPGNIDDPDDPVVHYRRQLEAVRLPPLSHADALRSANQKRVAITRERHQLSQAATTRDVAEAESELGPAEVARLAYSAWKGEPLDESARPFVEAVIEDMELGLSIHRREDPRG